MTKKEKEVQKALGTLPPMTKETERTLRAILRVGGDNWADESSKTEFWDRFIADIKYTLARNNRIMIIEKV